MFTFTAHCVSPPPRQVRLPAPIPLVLSGTTVASHAALRPAPAFAPAPRSPPAPALSLRQAQVLWSTTFTAPARVALLLLLRLFRASFGADACRSADAHCSPHAGRNHPAALRPLAPLGRPRVAVAFRAARVARPPARPRLITVTASRRPVPPACAGRASPSRCAAA